MASPVLFCIIKEQISVIFPFAVVLTSALAPSAGFTGDDVAFIVVDH